MDNDNYESLRKHLFIVFGFENINSLGEVRTLGEQKLNFVAVLIKSKIKITSKSKYLKKRKIFVNDIESGYELIKTKFSNEEEKPFIITSDDTITSFLDKRFDELVDHFFFNNCGKQGLLSENMEKTKQLNLASVNGLTTPYTYFWRHKDKNEIGKIKFPVMIKDVNSFNLNWKEKQAVCNNFDDLNKIIEKNPKSDLLIQSFIDKKNELAVHGYSYLHGKKCVMNICVTRKYVTEMIPGKVLNISMFNNEEIKNRIENIMKSIEFEGPFEAEFAIGKDNLLYFLEINFRNSGLGYLTSSLHASTILGWSKAMIEGATHVPDMVVINHGVTAMDEFADFRLRVLGKKLSFHDWRNELKLTNCTFYYNKKDKRPFYSALIGKIFHRNKKRII